MFERRYFEYNGQSSRDFGLILVHDGGLFERPFGENRTAITESVYGNPVPYFFGFESEPLSGEMQFYSLTP